MVRQRAGTYFAPDVAEAYLDLAGGLWPPGDDPVPLAEVFSCDPGTAADALPGDRRLAVCEALADFADLKSAPRGPHSHTVASLTAQAAVRLGLPPVRMLGMSGRAVSFGGVAEAYERFRLGYPAELFDMVLAYAGQPVRTALEIGAGTGKATRLFAQQGITVTATEPDAAMLAELRKHVPENVKAVQAAFEDLRPGGSYGLVYAAAALHWTNPQGRWSRAAALLEPGGVFASFGGPVHLADPAVDEAVRAAPGTVLGERRGPVS